MIGYTCGYLRYYYPLEFCTALLNNARNDDDLSNTTSLMKDYNINMYQPKFRKSKAEFMMDKEHNSIYKGVGSIKKMNNDVSNNLYELRDMKFDSFVDFLKISKSTGINKAQLNILIKIGYFEEFGDINKLIAYTIYYKLYGTKSQIKKSSIDIDLSDCCQKQTEKIYKELDNVKVVNKIVDSLDIKPCTEYEKLSYQLVKMGYTNIIIEDAPKNIFAITKVERTKYGSHYITLYRLYDGFVESYRVEGKWFDENKCVCGDIIKCFFKSKERREKRIINEKECYVPTGEMYSVIQNYSWVVKVNEKYEREDEELTLYLDNL